MNSFQRVIRDYGVNDQSTSPEDALLHALLAYGASDYEGADTFATNPVKEVVARLTSRGVSAIALNIIRQKLNSLSTAFDAGQLK